MSEGWPGLPKRLVGGVRTAFLSSRAPSGPDEARLVHSALHLGVPAVIVGAGAGLAAVAFRWLIGTATQIFTGTGDYSAVSGHPANQYVPWLGGAFVILAPVVGGLLYGPLVARLAPEARGHGVPEVMLAVARRGGRIRPRVALVKALASAICIGSGGSVGREGPIIQIGSALGSTVGRLTGGSEDRMRSLVACGAAAGIAATFNAPIAGVFFALELILRDFAARSFGVVVLAAITASVIGRSLLGDAAFLQLPAVDLVAPWVFSLVALLGLLAGAVGMGFTRTLYAIEDVCDRLWRGPEWLRPVVGGLLIGGVVFAIPQLYGVGYPVLDRGVLGGYGLGFVVVLMIGKVIATSLTLGIGGSGGVFAPSLFVGAMFGEAFGQIAALAVPQLAGQSGLFAVVGMGAVLAGTTRGPITAGIMLFELTGEYGIILPLLLAISLATAVSRALGKDTMYTLKLRRRGVDLDAAQTGFSAAALRMPVSALMSPPPPALSPADGPQTAARLMLAAGRAALPLLREQGAETQLITMRRVSEALGLDDEAGVLTLADFAQRTVVLREQDELGAVLPAVLDAAEQDGLPVVDSEGRLVGWLSQAAVLRSVAHEPR